MESHGSMWHPDCGECLSCFSVAPRVAVMDSHASVSAYRLPRFGVPLMFGVMDSHALVCPSDWGDGHTQLGVAP